MIYSLSKWISNGIHPRWILLSKSPLSFQVQTREKKSLKFHFPQKKLDLCSALASVSPFFDACIKFSSVYLHWHNSTKLNFEISLLVFVANRWESNWHSSNVEAFTNLLTMWPLLVWSVLLSSEISLSEMRESKSLKAHFYTNNSEIIFRSSNRLNFLGYTNILCFHIVLIP